MKRSHCATRIGPHNLALEHNGALDFDTVLVETHRLLTEHPKVARHYRLIYRHILIDEAQDTSLAQDQILKAVCGSDHGNVFMVADPAQSIYGFSGREFEIHRPIR